jgi:hypothetical protein
MKYVKQYGLQTGDDYLSWFNLSFQNTYRSIRHTEAIIPHKHINKRICSRPPRIATARTTRSCKHEKSDLHHIFMDEMKIYKFKPKGTNEYTRQPLLWKTLSPVQRAKRWHRIEQLSRPARNGGSMWDYLEIN